MYPDFKELLSIFNEHKVKYRVVGAYAVGVHAQPRATKDLDILVKADSENAEAVFASLAKFGAPLSGMAAVGFQLCSVLNPVPAERQRADRKQRRSPQGLLGRMSGMYGSAELSRGLISSLPEEVMSAAESR